MISARKFYCEDHEYKKKFDQDQKWSENSERTFNRLLESREEWNRQREIQNFRFADRSFWPDETFLDEVQIPKSFSKNNFLEKSASESLSRVSRVDNPNEKMKFTNPSSEIKSKSNEMITFDNKVKSDIVSVKNEKVISEISTNRNSGYNDKSIQEVDGSSSKKPDEIKKKDVDKSKDGLSIIKYEKVLTDPNKSDVKTINKDPPLGENYSFIPPLSVSRKKVRLGIKYHLVDKTKSKVFDRWDPALRKRKNFFEPLADKFLGELVKKGWIREISEKEAKFISHSKWVPKFDDKNQIREDKIRLTVALLDINEWSEKRNVNYPKEDTIKESLQYEGAKWAQKGDVEDGYWKIEIVEEDQPYTAFYAQGKIYMFTRLPMGHTNACNIFHEIVRYELEDIPGTINYIDDVMAWGPTKRIAEERFKEIEKRLHWIGMDLENTKSDNEAKQRLEFLRWVWDLTEERVRIFINEAKRQKILSRIKKYTIEVKGEKIEAGLANSIYGDIQYLLRGRQPIKELQDMKREMGGSVKKDCSVKIKNPFNLALVEKIDERLFGEARYRMNDPKNRSRFLHTDASEWGVGILVRTGILNRTYYWFQLKNKVKYTKIIENEAFAALLGLKIMAALGGKGKKNFEINVDNPTARTVLEGKNPKVKVVDVSKLREEVSRVGITWTTRLQNKSNEEWEMKVADLLSRNEKDKALRFLEEKAMELVEGGEIKRFKIQKGLWTRASLLGNEVFSGKSDEENAEDGDSSNDSGETHRVWGEYRHNYFPNQKEELKKNLK